MKRAEVQKAAEVIKSCAPEWNPKFAVILGSGLGKVMDSVRVKARISYADIPGFPVPTVAGHAGQAILGTIGETDVLVLKGRQHMYENPDMTPLKMMVRTVQELGADMLLLTNAVGSLREELREGELVNVTESINLYMPNPLIGPNDDDFGGRFYPIKGMWGCNRKDIANKKNQSYNDLLRETAEVAEVDLQSGVYAGVIGPSFESSADTKALAQLGADTVGMSTIPEMHIASHCGLSFAAVSAVSNMAAHLSDVELTHAHTLSGVQKAEPEMARLITTFAMKL